MQSWNELWAMPHERSMVYSTVVTAYREKLISRAVNQVESLISRMHSQSASLLAFFTIRTHDCRSHSTANINTSKLYAPCIPSM